MKPQKVAYHLTVRSVKRVSIKELEQCQGNMLSSEDILSEYSLKVQEYKEDQ